MAAGQVTISAVPSIWTHGPRNASTKTHNVARGSRRGMDGSDIAGGHVPNLLCTCALPSMRGLRMLWLVLTVPPRGSCAWPPREPRRAGFPLVHTRNSRHDTSWDMASPAWKGGATMALQFGVFDHIEPIPGQELDQIYRDRLHQVELFDAAGFYAYHLA